MDNGNILAGVLFGGFGGVEIGMLAAGIEPIWSVEKDPDIAAVAQANFDHKIIVADILNLPPDGLPAVDLLHASPPCPSFSQGNNQKGETEEDRALARQVANYIRVLRPGWFTLENVTPYRKSQSFKIILDALNQNGYMTVKAHVNTANFGVPQTRRRLLVRAVKGQLLPPLPPPERPWQGWYQAIEDLIPELPDSQFADWQMERLPDELKTFVVTNGSYENLVIRDADKPIFTITANSNQTGVRAFIVDCQKNGTPGKKRGLTIRSGDTPCFTITANQNKRTIRAAISDHHVVAMTVRALARFQAFPDWYKLPENKELACRGVGNAVPPLMYEKIARMCTRV